MNVEQIKISLAMIVRNEEKFLRQCLESAKPFVDEIVIVDTGSTDSTLAIAEQYAAKITRIRWDSDFAEARNVSLSHCTGDWILVLDADEMITPENGRRIREIATLADADRGAIECTLVYEQILPDGSKRTGSSKYSRLFRNDQRFRFTSAVHEQITPSICESGFFIAVSDIVINHYGYAQSLEVMKRKASRNLEILDRMLEINPFDYVAKYHRANSLVYLGEYTAAENEIAGVVEFHKFLPPHIYHEAVSLLDQLQRQRTGIGKRSHAIKYTPEALIDFALNAARFYLAGCTQVVAEEKKDEMFKFLAFMDAVVRGDGETASSLIQNRVVVIDPIFFFECVGGGWNQTLMPENAAQTEPDATNAGAGVAIAEALDAVPQ